MAETAQSAYLAARKLGKKYVQEHASNQYGGYLPVLDDRLRSIEVVGEISLGVHEIPLRKIVGTRTEGRSNAFAGNFMPLLEENTEFGIKWRKLYQSHISEGIREPIKVYEFINRYYVQEGNKRVSVLNFCDAPTIDAYVTRILPKRDESNEEISIYYEFIDFDRRAVFDNLWFSHRGEFTKLVALAKDFLEHNPEIKMPVDELIRSTHKTFRIAYKRAAPPDLSITTGDALLEYSRIFGFPAFQNAADISNNVIKAISQFEQRANKQMQVTVENNSAERVSSGFSFFIRKQKTSAKALFVFEGTPEKYPWTRLHNDGVRRLEYKYGDKLKVTRLYNAPRDPQALYDLINNAIADKPDVVFTTSPYMSNISLRIALEHPDMIVLNCDRAREGNSLHTYYPKTHDAIFLCGVVAGAMSKTDRIGYMTSLSFAKGPTCDLNAFSIGASIVNPRAEIINCVLRHADDFEEQNRACKRFTEAGADVALVQQSFTNPLSRKAPPGVFAQMYMLHPKFGYPDDAIGAAACDWFVFYDRVITDILKNELIIKGIDETEAVHFGWGLNTHLVEVYGVDAFMGHNATRLLHIFYSAVYSGRFHPFTGPIYDQEGNLRIEEFHSPTLTEIQNMRWVTDAVAETFSI